MSRVRSRLMRVVVMVLYIGIIWCAIPGMDQTVNSTARLKDANAPWLVALGSRPDFNINGNPSFPMLGDALNGVTGPGPEAQPDLPPVVKGVYLTSWMAGNTKYLNQLFDFIDRTEVNSLVIDVKDDTGTVSYPSSVELVKAIGSDYHKFDPVQLLSSLKERQIYPIARIVVFKDPYLARKRTDLAVKSRVGGLWHDNRGLSWVDPYNKDVWEYNIGIAKEAAGLGFREIQFDYVRFTSDGEIRNCLYPFSDGRKKAEVIRDFLKFAYQELKPLGVKISADIFGLACSADDDLGIGQKIEKVAEGVDVVCPMVYPSHYYLGSYNIPDPDRQPYRTVLRSLSDAKRKLAPLASGTLNHEVIIRPWLQDFSLRNRYGREQLLAQIKAVEDSGLKEWIFWNPTNRYDYRKYRSKEADLSNQPDAGKPQISSEAGPVPDDGAQMTR